MKRIIFLLLDVFLLILLNIMAEKLGKNEIPNFAPLSRNAKEKSGQLIRLRGSNRKYNAGRVEVFKNDKWQSICDQVVHFNDAQVFCKQLGFKTEALDVISNSYFGRGHLPFYVDNLNCNGVEKTLQDCKEIRIKKKPSCDASVGIQCKLNYPSKCQFGGFLFNGQCYYFFNDTQRTFDDAMANCAQTFVGGSLAIIKSQEENDFLSEALFSLDKGNIEPSLWYIGAKRINNTWRWNSPFTVAPSTFTKYSNGFINDVRTKNCLALSRTFSDPDYYYWTSVSCSTRLNFICQHLSLDIGCRVGNGRQYDGNANITDDGMSCAFWNNEDVVRHRLLFAEQKTWNHNFCRNPDNDQSPWCITIANTVGFCTVPNCSENPSPCDKDEVKCGNYPTCISKDFICDGEQDCPNNFDEIKCNKCGRRFVDDQLAFDESQSSDSRLARIVNGFEALPTAYPWTASLRIKPDEHYCGASVLTDLYLLTAAHCFDKKLDASKYEIRVGDWNTRTTEASEQTFDIEEISQHPNYVDLKSNDLALIRIKRLNNKGIQFTNFVQPICLPSSEEVYSVGMKCYVSGWGSTGTKQPSKLQSAMLPILSRENCTDPKVYGPGLSRSVFCAGYLNGGTDSCVGDSGGPLACEVEGKFTLFGTVSWGDGCGERNKPGVYTKVADFVDWIESSTNV